MIDRVKPLKFETDEFGTQIDYLPTELNANEDYVACKGISFEKSEDVVIFKDEDKLKFKDIDLNQELSLRELYESQGIRTFPFDLHFVSGTGLNTSMSNGSFFRVRPGTFASGSYSGYPSAFPLQMPFNAKVFSIVLTFRSAAFDFTAVSGPLLFEIEVRTHVYNGSSVKNRILVQFGEFSGNNTGTDTWRYILHKQPAGTDGFSYISGDEEIDFGEMIGCRFVKAPSGDRRINSFVDIIMKLNLEEIK